MITHRLQTRHSLISLLLALLFAPASWADDEMRYLALSAKVTSELHGLEYGHRLRDPASGISLYYSSSILSDSDYTFLGGNVGLRKYNGNVLAAFYGAGLFGGYSEKEKYTEFDGIDNDDDGWVDEHGESIQYIDRLMLTIYPEIGLELRLLKQVSISTYARYQIANTGPDNHFMYYGAALLTDF